MKSVFETHFVKYVLSFIYLAIYKAKYRYTAHGVLPDLLEVHLLQLVQGFQWLPLKYQKPVTDHKLRI